jgi:hypothetical protein
MKILYCGLAVLILASGARADDFVSLSTPTPAVEASTAYILIPAIGQAARAEVGEALYSEWASTITKKYTGKLLEGTSVQMENYRLDVTAGMTHQILSRRGDARPLFCAPVKRTSIGGLFGSRGFSGCLIDTKGNRTFDTAMFAHRSGEFPLEKPVPYSTEVHETTQVEQDKFQIDVLYQGMSRGEVKISYRESMNGTARPAFTQDVTYELGPDGTAVIGFKGMRLRVLKATGQSIDYVIEQTIPSFTKRRAELKEESNPKPSAPWYQK